MRRCILSVLTCAVLSLLLIEVQLQTVVAQTAPEEAEGDEPTCSLDPSANSDCGTTSDDAASTNYHKDTAGQELTRQVISLTDDTFDELTQTSTPSTWLIMFKTNSCAICKKAMPQLEELSISTDIVSHNDRELKAIYSGQAEKQIPEETKKKEEEEEEEEEDGIPKGPVYVWDESTEDLEIPKGPVYIATIDAGWSGRDTTKRFEVDATPTILLLRNEGHNNENTKPNVDSRSYYVYRGQRAAFPLRNFVLGGYAVRKRMDMPPPLSEAERKPRNYWGQLYEYFLSPSAKWAGGIIVKFLLAWFAFIGVLGFFMRVHNYAWGENADDSEEYEKQLELEKAKGRKEFKEESTDDVVARRKKAAWERKAKNRAKFAANKAARIKKKKEEGGDDQGNGDDDEFEGVGFSVKKADAKKGLSDYEVTENTTKSKNN